MGQRLHNFCCPPTVSPLGVLVTEGGAMPPQLLLSPNSVSTEGSSHRRRGNASTTPAAPNIVPTGFLDTDNRVAFARTQVLLIHEKNQRSKISCYCPFKDNLKNQEKTHTHILNHPFRSKMNLKILRHPPLLVAVGRGLSTAYPIKF